MIDWGLILEMIVLVIELGVLFIVTEVIIELLMIAHYIVQRKIKQLKRKIIRSRRSKSLS